MGTLAVEMLFDIMKNKRLIKQVLLPASFPGGCQNHNSGRVKIKMLRRVFVAVFLKLFVVLGFFALCGLLHFVVGGGSWPPSRRRFLLLSPMHHSLNTSESC